MNSRRTPVICILFIACYGGIGAVAKGYFQEKLAPDWELIASSTAFDTRFDRNSMVKLDSGNFAVVWRTTAKVDSEDGRLVIKAWSREAQDDAGHAARPVGYWQQTVEVDCEQKRWRVIASGLYADDGELLAPERTLKLSWHKLGEGHGEERIVRYVCETVENAYCIIRGKFVPGAIQLAVAPEPAQQMSSASSIAVAPAR